jgi:hypothetical protein
MKRVLSSLSAVVLLLTGLCVRVPAEVLFESSLDTSAGWTIWQEAAPSSQATFGFDYQPLGIPPAPGGEGSTRGLRLAANGNGSIQAITAATTAPFLGPYLVTVDFWGNTNGPLPAGGPGSTEFLGGGVGFTGFAPRAGASMLVSIEGNSTAADWRLDKGFAAQALNTGFYNPAITSLNVTSATSADPNFFFTAPFPGRPAPAAQAGTTGTPFNGTVAFGWHTLTILANVMPGEAEFWVDATLIGKLTQSMLAVPTEGAGSLTLLDPFTSISSSDLNTDPVFALFDNYRVQTVPSAGTGGLAATRLRRDLIILTYVMEAGAPYAIQRSTDLQTWTTVRVLSATGSRFTGHTLVRSPSTSGNREFYRAARLMP